MRVHGHLDIEDNDQIRIGTGDDLKIYHNGSHSYIQDDGTGNLNIQSNNVRINNAAGNENMALFYENGAVELYYALHVSNNKGKCNYNMMIWLMNND